MIERVLSVMQEDKDGRPRRRYYQLSQDGAEQALRALGDAAYARAKRHSTLAAQPGVLGVPL